MNNFFRVLILELRSRWNFAFLPVIFLVLLYSVVFNDPLSRGLNLSPGFIFIIQIPIMMFGLFQHRIYGLKAGLPPIALEFQFSQAVDRFTLFAAKATLYVLFSSLFGLTYLAAALNQPSLEVSLPNGKEQQAAARAFYAEHFPNAHIDTNSRAKIDIKSVTLPTGHRSMALTILALSLLFAAIYQTIMSFAPESRRWQIITIVASVILMPILLSWPLPGTSLNFSSYAQAVGFVSKNPLTVFALIGGLLVCAQVLCAQRFVRKEIL